MAGPIRGTLFTDEIRDDGTVLAPEAFCNLAIEGEMALQIGHHGKIADGTWNKPLFFFSIIAGALAIWKHRSNINRLRAGTENKIGRKKEVTEL